MDILSALGELLNFLGKFFPRLVLIRPTHAAVRFRGAKVSRLAPGRHVYLPLLTELHIFPVVRQTLNLPSQCLTTSDGESVVIGGIVVYEIFDIEKALVSAWEIDDVCRDYALLSITKVIFESTVEEIRTRHSDINDKLTTILSEDLEDYGIKVLMFAVSDYARCIVLKHVGIEAQNLPLLNQVDD